MDQAGQQLHTQIQLVEDSFRRPFTPMFSQKIPFPFLLPPLTPISHPFIEEGEEILFKKGGCY